MTIPNIAAYALPREAELPVSKPRWTPDAARTTLLIHDMQDYFLRFFERDAQPIATVVQNIARLAGVCRARGIPVIYSAQPAEQSHEQRGLLTDMWGPGLTAHPEGQAIVSDLSPAVGDILLSKVRYSAFHRTELHAILQKQGRDQLIICGVYAHIGCLLTACDAFMHDVQPFFVTDGVADFSAHYHKLAIDYVAERCAVTLDTSALIAALGGAEAPLHIGRTEVVAELATALEVTADEIGEEDDLFDLGLDSIRLMSLVEAFRARGATVNFAELAECRTLREVLALLETRQSGEWPVTS